jgi:hypothetical protein
MAYLAIELGRIIDEDRYREAERCHRINKASAISQVRPAEPIQILVRWLQSLAKRGQCAVTERQTRTLAELS